MQQLAAARTHGCPAGVPPSDLREKLVQTDHTELSQVKTQPEFWCLGLFIAVMMSSASCSSEKFCFLRNPNFCFIGLSVLCFIADHNAQRSVHGGSEQD